MGGAAFLASLLGSVAGSGGTSVLLPVMVLFFGVREAIPILTIANLVSNLSRVAFNRREIVLPVVGWFSLGAIPLALTGAVLFTLTPPGLLTRGLGVFLLGTVAWRRLSPRPPRLRLLWSLRLALLRQKHIRRRRLSHQHHQRRWLLRPSPLVRWPRRFSLRLRRSRLRWLRP